jgi:hypothetical protein
MRLILIGILVAALAGVPRAGTAGVTVALPAGWHAVPSAWLGSGVYTDPVTRVVVASAPIRWTDTGCQIASYAFSKRAVAIVIVEWRHLFRNTRLPPRPKRFTAANLHVARTRTFECFDGGGGSIQFADHGRHFMASVLLGRRAPAALAAEARAVLDTLRVRAKS